MVFKCSFVGKISRASSLLTKLNRWIYIILYIVWEWTKVKCIQKIISVNCLLLICFCKWHCSTEIRVFCKTPYNNAIFIWRASMRFPGIHLPNLPLSSPNCKNFVFESPMIIVEFRKWGAMWRKVKLNLTPQASLVFSMLCCQKF